MINFFYEMMTRPIFLSGSPKYDLPDGMSSYFNVRFASALRFVLGLFLALNINLNAAEASSLDTRPSVTYSASQSNFTLDASSILPVSGQLTYRWTLTGKPTGSTAQIIDPNAVISQLRSDSSGPYIVELLVTDGGVARAPIAMQFSRDSVEPVSVIQATGGVSPVTQSAAVFLSGAPSYDPDGGTLQYQWSLASKPAGSNAVFANATVPNASFVPDIAGSYSVSLTVTDRGNKTATDVIQLTSGKGLTNANAGLDQSVSAGSTVFVDAFASVQTAGLPLAAQWQIVSAPASSAALLADGSTFSPKQTGRQAFTPAVAGTYILNARLTGDGATQNDTVVIAVGPSANVPPIANAGTGKAAAVGDVVLLDATRSTDGDGTALTYNWSIVSAPQASVAAINNPTSSIASLTIDVVGTYIMQLAVSDGKSISYSTVAFGAVPQFPQVDAGPDALLNTSRVAAIGSVNNAANQTYKWSISELGTQGASAAGTFAAPTAVQTQVSFADVTQGQNPATGLSQYDLIVFENANIRSQVYGRSFIGGNLQGQTSDYGNGLNLSGLPAASKTILSVVGQVNGQWLNINNGGNVAAKGSVNSGINFNGGGRLINDSSLSMVSLRAQLEAFSTQLAALPATATIAIPTGQPGPVTMNAVPNAKKIAVFNVDGSLLLDNSKVQQIGINLNAADVVVINVSGNNVKFRQGNLVGNFNNASTYSKVIWNFKDAVNVQLDRSIAGAILAPKAQLLLGAQLKGSVVTRSINQTAAIVTPGYTAIAPFASAVAKVDAVVVQLKATLGGFQAFDTALVTNFNIAPQAKITLSQSAVTRGTVVTLNGNTSTDVNGDAISAKWALLSKPAGSNAALDLSSAPVKITPDRRGLYVIQLIASDGKLNSQPITKVLSALNTSPVITSVAPTAGVAGTPYSYAATASDPDGDALIWSLVSAPAGMTIDPATGAIVWTPVASGSFDAVVKASDGNGGENTQSFSVSVVSPGNTLPPVIGPIANTTLRPGQAVSFTVTATDPEGQPVTYWSASLPVGARLNSATGAFSFTADDILGARNVTFFATDGVLSASRTATITVVPWPDTNPTRLSGNVLDAQDYANGISTPVNGATIKIGSQTIATSATGQFAFNPLNALGTNAAGSFEIMANGSTAIAPNAYGSAVISARLYKNGENRLISPILLARRDSSPVQLTNVTDTLPANLRSCRIQRIDGTAGATINLASATLTAAEALPAGTTVSIWASSGGTYAIAGSGTVGADGRAITNSSGSVVSGTNIVIAPLALTGIASKLQPKDSYVPSLQGEGNLQTGFSLPSYVSIGQNRAASFIYNSFSANPRPIITADVTIPAAAALTATLEAELYISGQKVPGITVTRLTATERATTSLPVENDDAVASVSVFFDASALPTGAYPYELYVFAGQTCGAAAAKITGNVLVNNRSTSPYGSGWKPTELQQLSTKPDGSVVIEEPNGGLSNFESQTNVGISPTPGLYDVFDPERADTSDIDGDGDIDLAVAEGKTGNVLIFTNNGPGTRQFSGPVIVDAGLDGNGDVSTINFEPDTSDVAIGDLNGDGLADLATSHQFGGVVRAHLKQTDGSYSRIDFAISDTPSSIDLGDFDGDGNLDVAASSFFGVHVVFGPISSSSVVKNWTTQFAVAGDDIAVYDLNSDGKDDIVVDAAFRSSPEIVSVSSDRNSISETKINIARNPSNALQQFVSIGDINGDGSAEIAFSSEGAFTVVGESSPGSGQYNLIKRFSPPSGSNTESVAISDFTGNGKGRLFGVNKTNKLYIYNESYIFKTGTPASLDIAGSGDDAIVTADFDGDGVEDIVTFFETPVAGTPDDVAVYYGSALDSNEFASPAGDYSTLTKNADGTTSRRYKNGTVVTFNALGQQQSVSDTNGNTTNYAYNANGSLASVTDPAGLITAYTYSGNGKLELITDPDGRVTLFNYNSDGRLISIFYPDGTSIKYIMDSAGRIVSQTDQRGQTSTYNYSPAGRLTSVTTPDAGSVRMAIGRSLGLASFGVNLGAPAQANFVAPQDRVTSLSDARGNTAEQEVNQWGAVIRTKDPIGRETLYERDGNNHVTRITAPSSATTSGNFVTELSYDERGNVLEKKEAVGTPLARTMRYTYEPVFNKVTSEFDASGYDTQYRYDAQGNVTTVLNYSLSADYYTYNTQGLMLTAVDRRGSETRYSYDARGQLDTVTDPDGFVTRTLRDGRGNPLSTLEAVGTTLVRRSDQTFDVMNRLLTSKNAEGEISTYTYDAEGNPLTVIDPTGISSTRIYDEKGRLKSSIDPSSGATIVAYDLNDNITRVTASDGTISAMTYDAVNRVSESVDALGITRRVAYDSRDNIIAITDGRGNTTTFAYDALDRQISRTNPNGNVWRFEYDARDLRTTTIKPDGTRVVFTYDYRGLLLSSFVPGDAASRRTYEYYRDYLLDTVTSADGTADEIIAGFGYNARDLPVYATMNADGFRGRGSILYHSYDALGRRTLMQDTYGTQTSYGYDKADRLTSIGMPSGKTTTLQYDDAGRRTSVGYSNGLTTNTAFQTPLAATGTSGRLASIAHGITASGQTGSALNLKLGTFTYGYDVKGNITGIAETGTGLGSLPRARGYSLDAIERLVAVTDGSVPVPAANGNCAPNLAGITECYRLDSEGNRIVSKTAVSSSSYHVTDPANRVTEDEKTQFEYDANGNMVRKTVKASGLTWRYSYTVYDELAKVSRHASASSASPADLTKSYVYDGLGRRTLEKTRNLAGDLTAATAMVYDGGQIAYEQQLRLDGGNNQTGTEVISYASILCALPEAATSCRITTRWYTASDVTDDMLAATPDVASAPAGTPASPTINGGTIPQGTSSPSAASYAYHTDHQGSVRAVTNDAGQIVNAYAYDAYGNPEEAVESLSQPYRYTGREWDGVARIYHYRARAYDAETGRFLQEDPLHFQANDLNVYRYVSNNPANFIDPTGKTESSIYSRLSAWAAKQAGTTALRTQSKFGCAYSIIEAALSIADGDVITGVEEGVEGCSLKIKPRTPGLGSPHGNSLDPTKRNHVYVIMDANSLRIRKIGISMKPLIKEDTFSPRAGSQLRPGEITVTIGYRLSRAQALAVECAFIIAHKIAFGQAPPGNIDRCSKL